MTRREKRKRERITRDDREAAALACQLPDDLFKKLRGDRLAGIPPAPAKQVIRLFTYDHGDLHALGGSDTWDNLTPRLRGPQLKAKDNRDTSIVAKSDRISAAHREHLAAMARKLAGPSPFGEIALVIPAGTNPSKHQVLVNRAVRKIRSRGFDKGHRPLRGRNSLQRRPPCK